MHVNGPRSTAKDFTTDSAPTALPTRNRTRSESDPSSAVPYRPESEAPAAPDSASEAGRLISCAKHELPAVDAIQWDPFDAQVDVVGMGELPSHAWEVWKQIRAARPEFSAPFFSPEFAQAVHDVRGDVRVALIRQNGNLVGFLPHHRRWRIAYPVGRFLNDAHQLIAMPSESIQWNALLRKLSLRSLDVHAMVDCEPETAHHRRLKPVRAYAAILGDDSRGFLARLSRQHKTIGRQPQKTRKMIREIGPVQLEVDCRDAGLLEKTIEWKRQQYRRTHILDLFQPAWTRDLMVKLHQRSRDDRPANNSLRGMLSVLRAGDRVVAAHFGMLEDGRLHYWFPAYDPQYARYSPGTALFRGLLEVATDHGIHTIDMGYGEQPYKRKQTDTVTEVVSGSISRCKVHRFWKMVERTTVSVAQSLPMKSTAKRVVRSVRPHAGIGKLS